MGELFRVRVFNRVDRVERVEVGELDHEIHETHENYVGSPMSEVGEFLAAKNTKFAKA